LPFPESRTWAAEQLRIRAQVEDLLDAGASIKHRGQQRVVAATVTRGAIDGQQGGGISG
jgi:hypothetical protein